MPVGLRRHGTMGVAKGGWRIASQEWAPAPAISSHLADKKGLAIGKTLVAAFVVAGEAVGVIIQPLCYASFAFRG